MLVPVGTAPQLTGALAAPASDKACQGVGEGGEVQNWVGEGRVWLAWVGQAVASLSGSSTPVLGWAL